MSESVGSFGEATVKGVGPHTLVWKVDQGWAYIYHGDIEVAPHRDVTEFRQLHFSEESGGEIAARGWDEALAWARHNRDYNNRDVLDRGFNPYRSAEESV